MPKTKRRRRRNENADPAALPKRSHDLYYLFPGMAHGARRRFVRNLVWSLVVGVFVAVVLAAILYFCYMP